MKHLPTPLLLRHLILWSFLVIGLGSASAQNVYPTPYVITTFAGEAGLTGSTNSNGINSLFAYPEGIAVDSSGNIYVADTYNETIRLITSAGVATTLAGTTLSTGSADGAATTTARFTLPFGIAVDGEGHVYVADTGNNTIREIAAGNVTTIAGTASSTGGSANGTGSQASFSNPAGIAVDSSDNVYVADEGNDTIREVTPAGVVTTIAGSAGSPGSANGVGASAQFNGPEGVALDSTGNLYVADTGNDIIRKMTPSVTGGVTTWTVTTLAGTAGAFGSTDGTGSAAKFYHPVGVTVDSAGNVYATDTSNDTIRKITSAGVVTTLAGSPGGSGNGSSDGIGASAQFSIPFALAVDSAGSIYIADTDNSTIRLAVPDTVSISPQSSTVSLGASVTFTIVGGSGTPLSYQWQLNNVAIPNATASTYTIGSVQSSNAGTYTVIVTYSSGSITSNAATLTIGNVTPPTVTSPAGQTVDAGANVTFTAVATGGGLTYQWYFNGASIASATSSTLTLSNVGTEQAGYYVVGVTNSAGLAISNNNGGAGLLTVNYSARLTNMSARADVGTNNNILIGGLGISGTGSKQLLLRADGPQLAYAPFSLTGVLSHPQLTLFDNGQQAGESNTSEIIASDIGWGNSPTTGPSPIQVSPQDASATMMNSVGAFSLNSGSADSAMLITAPLSNYTFEISGVDSTTGIALAEIYDADTGTPTARLSNISGRALVGTGGNIIIGGFGITGTTSETVLIRGDGPQLAYAPFSLTGVLATPQLTLFDNGHQTGESSSEVIASNTGWGNSPTTGPSPVLAGIQPATDSVFTQVGAFSLNANSADCAMIVTLPPGNYTVELGGVSGSSGVGLVEIYEVP